MDEIIDGLLVEAAALGVWLYGPKGDVICGAVKDPSITPPVSFVIAGETYVDFGERQIFATPIAQTPTTLVLVFDKRSSYGLVRLRVRNASAAIRNALYRGVEA